MKLPSFKRLYSSDFAATFKQLVDKLGSTLNYGIEVLYDALNNGLTFEDNFLGTVTTITLSVDSTGKPVQTASFILNQANNVDGVIVLSATNAANSTVYPTGAPFINGTQSGTTYTINHITGLQPNVQYSLLLVAIQNDGT
jgi:hypothetical protein